MRILSIQSSVAYGHVGNAAAVFPLQRLGIEVMAVNTVEFSNHTGYAKWRGPVLPAHDVADVIDGIADLDVLPGVDAVLSGYQGGEDVGGVILDAVATVKATNAEAIYCADPVMGDRWCGFYVRPGIPALMRDRVIPAADITTPNQFELEYLTDRPVRTLEELLEAVDSVRSRGPGTVLVTSVEVRDLPETDLSMVAVDGDGAYLVSTPKLDLKAVSGSGDLTTALFLAHYLRTRRADAALERTASSVFGVLEATAASGNTEMEIVTAQEVIADPPARFTATRL